MNWQPELDELQARTRMAHAMGGPDKVKRQHDAGRLTVRERIDGLVDSASFREVGALSGMGSYGPDGELETVTPANGIFGRARIDGRPVVVLGDDFTVRGGSADATIAAKPLMAEQMAHDYRIPILRVIEGSGGGGSGQDDRDHGPCQPARWYRHIDGLSLRDHEHVGRTGGGARPRFGGRAGRRAARRQPLQCYGLKRPRCSWPARPWWRGWGRNSTSRSWAGGKSRPAPAPWTMPSRRRRKRSPAPGASCPTCPPPSMNCRPCSPATTRSNAATKTCSPSSRVTAARSTRCAPSWRRWSTRGAFSRWAAGSAGPSSPAWRGWVGARSR